MWHGDVHAGFGSSFPVGTTTVNCSTTAGPSCSFTVTVTAGCSITCPANITTSNTSGQCGAVVNYPAPTATPGCGTVTCTPASGSTFPIGTTTVNCSTTAGPSCSFTVTVNDTQPPTITCPANITVGNATGQCSAVVNYTTPAATDNCPGATAACVPASGSTFPVGTTTVTCTTTDASMNTATCSFS
ncbi:MAG: HYR domain-containing protein [Blastocatellia bacterium]|nr:HYR domain-containing protein [Blastocatellia bacterium]